MPFIAEIVSFINGTLQTGALKAEKLQPAKLYPLTTTVGRIKDAKKKQDPEILPAVVDGSGKFEVITPNSSLPIQVYHRLINNAYSLVKKSYGDDHDIQVISELTMVVLTNSKITGRTKEALEPVVLFGIPQKLSSQLLQELNLVNCLITPVSSNLDQLNVYRQEYPKSDYVLNDQMGMFSIRYRITLTVSKNCIDTCFC